MTTTPALPNPFFDIKPGVVLGAYVSTPHGHTGRVYQVHFGCPESQEWQELQVVDVANEPTKRWVSVLVHDGGAVTFPETLVELTEPFVLANASAILYFGEGTR